MRLALSSAAAPALAAPELLAACAARGLAGVELVESHGHGIGPESDEGDIRELLAEAERRGTPVLAFRCAGASAASPAAARLSRLLGAPVIAPPGALDEGEARAALALYAREGGQLLLAHESEPARVRALRALVEAAGTGGLAWDVTPAPGEGFDAGAVLACAGAALRHIRLLGGGPEAAQQAGQGIGELSFRLAITGYAGAMALAPSTPRYLTAWGMWLGQRGWGCGSSKEEKQAVKLGVLR